MEFYPFITRYNIACSYALSNDAEAAFSWLDKAMESGYSNVDAMKTDKDLTTLHSDPRFEEMVQKADKNARPCLHNPRYNEFDFWVGEWDVYNAQGQKVGENIIEKDLNGCRIVENWSSGFGGFGKSINYYDPGSGKWKQNWVDAGGGVVWYEGEVIDGAMHFTGENASIDGVKKLSKVILKPIDGGKVHHVIEHSTDDGKTWTPYFDGTYVPKESPAAAKSSE